MIIEKIKRIVNALRFHPEILKKTERAYVVPEQAGYSSCFGRSVEDYPYVECRFRPVCRKLAKFNSVH